MKTILMIGLLSLSVTAQSAVVKSYDTVHGCNLYRVVETDNENQLKINSDDVVIYPKAVYGLSLSELEIDFNNREAKAQIYMNVVLGLNRTLVSKKSVVEADNEQFNLIINQVNRKLYLMEKICLTSENKISYVTLFNESTTVPR